MIEKPVQTPTEAVTAITDGASVMYGGFLACGTPLSLVNALMAAGTTNLTIIGNDTSIDNPRTGLRTGVAHLIANDQVRRVVTSHIGTNRETQRRLHAGEIEVELVPQGTLAERIRCAAYGLGGALTPTGVGTVVAQGKQLLTVDGREFILERPLRADVALVKAKIADRAGNVVYSKTARNFNPVMAMAADLVIVEADRIVDVGAIDPDAVMTPGLFIDILVPAADDSGGNNAVRGQ